MIAEFIVGSIDERYLRREIDDMVDDLAFTQSLMVSPQVVEQVLHKVQQLDPPGIGARTLQECLTLQLDRKKPSVEVLMASKIIKEGFALFSKKHYKKMQERFDVDEALLKQGLDEIERLNPKPGGR